MKVLNIILTGVISGFLVWFTYLNNRIEILQSELVNQNIRLEDQKKSIDSLPVTESKFILNNQNSVLMDIANSRLAKENKTVKLVLGSDGKVYFVVVSIPTLPKKEQPVKKRSLLFWKNK
jgi:hypothetical protein